MVSRSPKVIVLMLLVFTTASTLSHRAFRRRHNIDHAVGQFNEILPLDDEGKHLALLHNQRVSEAGSCDVPKEQVIHVSDHYPGKYYLPHCTILHRCGKHAGCCGVDKLKCVAAHKEKVTLYFYSVKFADEHVMERQIEKLVFTNHTKCACIGHLPKHDL